MQFRRSLKAFWLTLVYLYYALYKKDYFAETGNARKDKMKVKGIEIETATQGVNRKINEPISFIIFAKNDRQFQSFLKKTGWSSADPVTFFNSINCLIANIFNLSYDAAPMTPYFWHGKTQDFNIQRPTEKQTVRERHHARFWKYPKNTKPQLYAGMASYDKDMKRVVAHTIDPNLDKEREFLFNAFKKTGMIKSFKRIKLSKVLSGKIFTGDRFRSDGYAYLIYLNE